MQAWTALIITMNDAEDKRLRPNELSETLVNLSVLDDEGNERPHAITYCVVEEITEEEKNDVE